jgi:hypothetical protein
VTDTTLETIFSGREAASEPETVVETPVAEALPPEQQGEIPAEEGTAPQVPEPAMVPKAALDEARGKVRKYTDTVASFEQQLADHNKAWQRRFDEVERRLQQPQQQAEQPQSPDYWVDPETAIEARFQQLVAPVLRQVSNVTEQVSHSEAVRAHGEEAVEAAYTAISARINTDPVTQVEYQRIMASGDPWGSLVQWHNRQPEVMEQRIRTQMLEEIKQQGHLPVEHLGNPSAPPAIMPSDIAGARNAGTRSGPAYSGPPTLNDIFKR